MKLGHVLVVGSINMDMVTTTDCVPGTGETLRGKSFQSIPGGKGANQAVAAARLGQKVSMIGCVGADSIGKACVEALADENVDVSRIQVVQGVSTGVAAITVSNGDNSIIIVSGANDHVTPDMVAKNEDMIATSDVILLQLEIPFETVEKVAEIARRHHIKVFLNPAPIRPLSQQLLESVDWIIPNEHEVHLIPSRFREKTVVTRGAKGASLIVNDQEHAIASCKVVAQDTTGAGDTFCAAFAVAIEEGQKPQEACRFACAAAALSVTKHGARGGMPVRSEVEQMLSQQ